MPHSARRFVAALLTIGLLVAARAQPSAPATPPPDKLATLVEKSASSLPAGGLVLAEVSGDSVHYFAAGQPAPSSAVPPEKVIFELGSITKVFTALLLAEAVNEHRAALTDPITKYLPSDLSLAPATAAITLEQLATHTSGLPRLPTNFRPANQRDPYADYAVDNLYAFLRDYRPEQSPPQPAAYSNLGFGLLGHLLERIYGKPYAQLVHDRIAAPLGLADTTVSLNSDQTARFAQPYSGTVAVEPWRFAALAGCGAIRSTAADLAKLAQALVSPGDTPLHAAWKLICQPRTRLDGVDLGLAILLSTRDGQTVYFHNGGTGGFRSYFELNPATRHATILWLNNDAFEPGALVVRAHETSAPAPSIETPPAAAPALSPAELAAYAGVYALSPTARFTAIVDATGRLQLRLTGQPFLPVQAIAPDRFTVRSVGAEFWFSRDAAGTIDGVTLHQHGRELPARRTPEPPPHVIFLSPDKLAEYVGRYELAPQVVFEMTTRAGHLFAKLTGQPAAPVFCTAPDEFVYDVVAASLTFERDAQGTLTAVVLHQNGRDQRALRLKN